eukprot:3716879-Rhodomonas_salina.1
MRTTGPLAAAGPSGPHGGGGSPSGGHGGGHGGDSNGGAGPGGGASGGGASGGGGVQVVVAVGPQNVDTVASADRTKKSSSDRVDFRTGQQRMTNSILGWEERKKTTHKRIQLTRRQNEAEMLNWPNVAGPVQVPGVSDDVLDGLSALNPKYCELCVQSKASFPPSIAVGK